MSETDSFIDEVTEEVRRDRLYALYRKYGWIAITAVVLFVGGTALNEWRKARAEAAAQALGDSVMAALEQETPEARASSLEAAMADTVNAETIVDLLKAAAIAEAGDREKALAYLEAVADDAGIPQLYRDAARLKEVILRGADMARDERLATLNELATAGRPYRALALEQIALSQYEFGDNSAALATLMTLLDEPGITEGLRQRTQQLIVALGGDLSTSPDASKEG